MQFTFAFAFALLATIGVVSAVPTGHTFMRASCDIAGCVAALAPGVVSCADAAAQEGANVIADAGCLASAANTIANFPADCNQCAEEFDIAGKVKAAESAVEGAASSAVDDVEGAAKDVGDAIGSVF